LPWTTKIKGYREEEGKEKEEKEEKEEHYSEL